MGFKTTRWSLIVGAGDDAPNALSELIEIYWFPLYAFARRFGLDADAAQDAVQGFFAALIEKRFLDAADPERGRFRTFLLTAFKRYVSKEREKARALKRGGGRTRLSFDFDEGEARYQLEPVDDATAERLFERQWALTLLDRVMRKLSIDQGERGDAGRFAELRVFLVPGTDVEAKAAAAERLGMSPQAFRVALHRLRRRYRALVEAEIRETVSDPAEVEAEIQHLIEALG